MSRARRAWSAEYVKPSSLGDGFGFGLCRVEGPSLPASLLLRLDHDDKTGEVVCTGIAMGLLEDPPIRVTATALRLPLQEILAAIAAQTGWPHFIANPGWAALLPQGVLRARPSAKGYTDDELRELAHEYRQARRENPRAPTKTLADKRHLSDQAIRYQLRLAESRGLLKRRGRARTKPRGGRR